MNSRILWSLIIFICGLALLLVGIFANNVAFLIYYGLFVLIVGIIIFFNKNEDKVEQIKLNKSKGKKDLQVNHLRR